MTPGDMGGVDVTVKAVVAVPKRVAKPKPMSRPQRWADAAQRAEAALQDLLDIQSEYESWRDGLPENLQSSPVAEKLEAICDIDLASALDAAAEAGGCELPRGFGRD